MSSIKVALATKLTSITALTNLVSTRITAVKLPQGFTLPAVFYRLTGDDPERDPQGLIGKTKSYFEIVCCAKSDTAAEAVGDTIWKSLNAFDGTVSGVKIQSISIISRRDEYDYDINVYQRIIEIKIGHIEPIT